MYRVLHKLSIGRGQILYPGSFSTLEWLDEKGLTRLERKGAISKVHPPPLIALPGWGRRARRVEENLGVEDAEQFLETDNVRVAEAMKVKVDTVAKWKADVMRWLTAEPPPSG